MISCHVGPHSIRRDHIDRMTMNPELSGQRVEIFTSFGAPLDIANGVDAQLASKFSLGVGSHLRPDFIGVLESAGRVGAWGPVEQIAPVSFPPFDPCLLSIPQDRRNRQITPGGARPRSCRKQAGASSRQLYQNCRCRLEYARTVEAAA